MIYSSEGCKGSGGKGGEGERVRPVSALAFVFNIRRGALGGECRVPEVDAGPCGAFRILLGAVGGAFELSKRILRGAVGADGGERAVAILTRRSEIVKLFAL